LSERGREQRASGEEGLQFHVMTVDLTGQ